MPAMDSRLHGAWLSQLVRDYSDICYQYGIRLRPPILAISSGRRQLGSWSAGDRRLSLSQVLISNHAWRLTLQILKHEMAHQICSELYGQDDAGHGPLFREACLRLGLDAPFHRASADLAEGLSSLEAEEGTVVGGSGQQIIDKVRKLLALGESDNEHEAALAMKRAGELLVRYRLDVAALAEDEGMAHRSINTGGRTLPSYRKAICSLIEANFAVRVICAASYDPLTDSSFKTIELLGRAEEVAIAEHCYHFLEDRLQVLWSSHRRSFTGNGRVAQKSYFLGLLAGFRETLECSRPQAKWPARTTGPTSGLPALREQQRLDEFVAFRFPRLRRLRGKATRMDREAFSQALAEGRCLTLHLPVEQSGQAPVRLLP